MIFLIAATIFIFLVFLPFVSRLESRRRRERWTRWKQLMADGKSRTGRMGSANDAADGGLGQERWATQRRGLKPS
jgi:hypothetical protein